MTETYEENSRIFRALADTTRRLIIDELSQRERQSLFELYARVVMQHGIGQSRQAFSRHLSVLEDAGMIEVEWKGTTKLHTLNAAPLARLHGGWLSKYGRSE